MEFPSLPIVASKPMARFRSGRTKTPSRAKAENGRLWFEWMVEDLSALIERGMAETPPLEFSYFSRGA